MTWNIWTANTSSAPQMTLNNFVCLLLCIENFCFCRFASVYNYWIINFAMILLLMFLATKRRLFVYEMEPTKEGKLSGIILVTAWHYTGRVWEQCSKNKLETSKCTHMFFMCGYIVGWNQCTQSIDLFTNAYHHLFRWSLSTGATSALYLETPSGCEHQHMYVYNV